MPLDSEQLYSEARALLRHYLRWREKLLGGYLALVAALAVAVWSSRKTDRVGSAITLFAILLTLVSWLLERRNRALLFRCIDAGAALERDASLRGVFTEINQDAPRPTHSDVQDWLFGLAMVAPSILAVILWRASGALT
jgi:hypothetical protein